MPRLLIHDLDPEAFYYGGSSVSRIYYGSTLVYPIGYVLGAEYGEFNLIGQEAILQAANKLDAVYGEFSIAGQDVNLEHHRLFSPEHGIFAINGQDVDLNVSILLDAEFGAYSILGQDVNLRRQILDADHGVYSVNGFEVELFYDSMLVADHATYSINGQDASLRITTQFLADGGEYEISGKDAGLLRYRVLDADPGVFSIEGQIADLERQLRLLVDYGSYSINGQSAALEKAFKLQASAGTFSVTGRDATLTKISNIQVTYVTTMDSVDNAITHNFSGANIGVAASDRLVVVGLIWEATSNRTLNSATIGGNAATIHLNGGGVETSAAIFSLRVPAGTTADISCALSGSAARAAIGIWTITGQLSDTPIASQQSASNSNATSRAISLAMTANSVAIAMLGNQAPGAITWTGATERFDAAVESNTQKSGADYYASGAETRNISVSHTSTNGGLAGVAWA